jgi:hypothetical protein
LSGYSQGSSDIHEDGWFVRELLLLNAHDWTMHRVVDVWQVGLSGSLSDPAELVVYRPVTKADPSLVGSKIWNWDASQMRANGGANQDFGVTSIGESCDGLLIQQSRVWKGVGVSDLSHGKSSDEDDLTVPSCLEHFSWWKLSDVKLLVRLSDVSGVGDHLAINDGDDGLDTDNVRGDNEPLEHVHLSSLDLVVSILLVPDSVLVEPVIGLGLGIKRVTEVGWSGRGDPVGWSLGTQEVVDQLLVLSVGVLS